MEINHLNQQTPKQLETPAARDSLGQPMPEDSFLKSPPGVPEAKKIKNISTIGTLGGVLFSGEAAAEKKELEKARKVVGGGLSKIEKGKMWVFDPGGNTGSTTVYDKKQGILYTGIGNIENSYLIAFNRDGSIRWTYTREPLKGTPKLDDQGNVYIRTGEHLHKIDSNGKKLWSFDTPYSTRNDTPLSPGPEGIIYAVAGDQEKYSGKQGLYAIKDGKQLWYQQFSSIHIADPAPVYGKKGIVYLAAELSTLKKGMSGWMWREKEDKPYLVAYDALTGEIKHQKPVKNWPSILDNGLTEGPDGTIYAIHSNSRKLSAYTPDLKRKWTYKLEDKVTMDPGRGTGVFRHGPMFDQQGNLFIASDGTSSYPEGYLIRLDPQGKEVFNCTIPDGAYYRPVLTGDDTICIPKKGGQYAGYDTNGAVKREISTDLAAGKTVQGDADSLIEVDESRGTIIFVPNTEKILKTMELSLLEKLIGTPEESAGENSGSDAIVDEEDFIMIGGIKLDKAKFSHLLR